MTDGVKQRNIMELAEEPRTGEKAQKEEAEGARDRLDFTVLLSTASTPGPASSLWGPDLDDSVFWEDWAEAEMGAVRQKASPGSLGRNRDDSSSGIEAWAGWGQVGVLGSRCLPSPFPAWASASSCAWPEPCSARAESWF